jgi:hypothetical protein
LIFNFRLGCFSQIRGAIDWPLVAPDRKTNDRNPNQFAFVSPAFLGRETVRWLLRPAFH